MIKVLDTTFLVDLIRGKEETRALWGKKDELLGTISSLGGSDDYRHALGV